MGLKVMIYGARASFLTLGEPEYFQGKKQRDTDKRRWSATGIIEPGVTKAQACDASGRPTGPMVDAKTLIDELLVKVATEKWPTKAKTMLAAILPDPKGCAWMDGNRKDYAGYAGNWTLTAHRTEDQGRPLAIDSDRSPIYKPTNDLYEGKAGRIYSGCYVNLHAELWAQDNAAGKGLRAGLLGVQRAKDGDSFGGGSAPVADAFGDVADGSDADDLA